MASSSSTAECHGGRCHCSARAAFGGTLRWRSTSSSRPVSAKNAASTHHHAGGQQVGAGRARARAASPVASTPSSSDSRRRAWRALGAVAPNGDEELALARHRPREPRGRSGTARSAHPNADTATAAAATRRPSAGRPRRERIGGQRARGAHAPAKPEQVQVRPVRGKVGGHHDRHAHRRSRAARCGARLPPRPPSTATAASRRKRTASA